MNLTDTLLGEGWYWAAWAVWIPLFARSALRAPWGRLKDATQINVWLGMVVLLTLIWSLKAGVRPGLTLHLLGATVFTLSFGPHLAFIGLSLVTLGVAINGMIGLFAYAMSALMLAGIGVALSQFLFRLLSRALPQNFFIYVFVNGFLGAALTILGVGACLTLLFAASGTYAWDYLISEYFPYYLLLAFSEAWLSGMILTLFVVYQPHWVGTFDDASYLSDK